jgi:cellulose 1,4-beta-cellobiosidase
MCISGSTTTSTSGYAGVGLSLNDSGGTNPVKSAYNATSHSIVGFAITIAGSTGGLTLRINYTTAASSSNPAPFFEVAGPGTYQVMFSQASVPAAWAVPNAGAKADATSVFDVQVQVAGGTAASYNFCVTSLKPIMSTTGGGCASGTCGTLSGSNQICGAQNTANVGNYSVQNNIFNNGTGQCVTPTVNTSGSCAGFSTSFTGTFGNTGNSPSSYPSVIYGWQAGTLYGCYQPKQVSAITSIPSTWSFTTPTSGKWDAAYDIWFGSSATTANNAQTTELMIWQNYGGNAQPVGSMIGSMTFNSVSYEVWTGTVSTWKYIAYRRSPGSSTAVDFDLKPFVMDAVSRGQVTNSSYLLGIQAGFEIWQSGGTAPSVQSFNVSVN